MIFYIAKDISCFNSSSHFSPVYVNQICLALLIDVPSQLPEAHEQGKPCDLENTIWAYAAHSQICLYKHVVNIN